MPHWWPKAFESKLIKILCPGSLSSDVWDLLPKLTVFGHINWIWQIKNLYSIVFDIDCSSDYSWNALNLWVSIENSFKVGIHYYDNIWIRYIPRKWTNICLKVKIQNYWIYFFGIFIVKHFGNKFWYIFRNISWNVGAWISLQ